jgi:hypothetical protein
MLLTDDYPHRIPAKAHLRWRENWFFLMLDPKNDVYCIGHMSVQPTFGVARFTFNISVKGEKHLFSDEVASPDNFEELHAVTVGPLTFDFTKPHVDYGVRFQNEMLELDCKLRARMHRFDYGACAIANPDAYSMAEMVSAGGHDFWHQNQLLTFEGTLKLKTGVKGAGTTISLSGPAYRDHSWGMRNDLGTLSHTWGFMIFKDRVFHAQAVNNRRRPESWMREGYTGTAEGNLALLKDSKIDYIGEGSDDMPETVHIQMTDSLGARYTVKNDVGNAYARLSLLSQKPSAVQYLMFENVCDCIWEETGEKGIAVIEIGKSRPAG